MDGPLNKVRENRHFMDVLHIKKVPNFVYPKMIRQYISTGAAGARTPRSLGHHLLHPLILRPRALFYITDQYPQIQIPNTCPDWKKRFDQQMHFFILLHSIRLLIFFECFTTEIE